MDHSTSSGDEDRASSRHREGYSDARYGHRHSSNSRDYDTRSQSSHRSDEASGRGDHAHYNLSASSSVGSHGSGGGDSRGFPLHGHVHFRHATISASHLLNGDPAHQFPPSLYQPSGDAPKSDTATVCSNSMLEDIEDVGSHYDGDSTVTSNSRQQQQQHHHNYPPPSSLRRSNSKEGNRLVDFAERSQAVFPKQSKSTVTSQESSNNDEDSSVGQGMGPPLSRHWLLQHHGISPFRTGSVKSGGSTAGSDVVVNVGSDCGGSLTDLQSVLSQEDAVLLTSANSEISGEAIAVSASATLDTSTNSNSATTAEDDKKPHPLLCDQSGTVKNGRISPGGTIYRGRGVRRYKGRFYALPLKRFHQDGVHLHSDSEPEGNTMTNDRNHHSGNHQDGDNYHWEQRHSDDYHRRRDYYDSSRYQRERGHDRDRSRSRSRSPPTEDRKREARNRNLDQNRGYKIEKK